MAKDKNKIHDLVSESDEDTSELEALPDTIAADPDYDFESESDAATHAFESLNKSHDDQTVAQLRAELRARDNQIDRLEFDVEQLRARWTGLETELKVREELTVKVTSELEQTRQALSAAQQRLETSDQTIASLESSLTTEQEQTRSLTARLNDTGEALHRETSHREKTEERVVAEEAARQEFESRSNELQQENRRLQHEHARLSGQVAANAATIRELHSRLEKTEDYADTLRVKLQDRLAEVASISSGRENLQAAVDTARQRTAELDEQLEAERKSNADLANEIQGNQKKFEEEIRTIRFELDAAQETVAENQTVAEQLTADLIENSGFRRALETQLAESDDEHKKESSGLNSKLKRLQQQIDDYERKVTNKDAAINALLSELAGKPQEAESSNETEAVVHKLSDRKASGAEEKRPHEKDRITRLLIGNIDGQELRFPLFKNKLTIGRTAHNDIQLKAQYISRRHAVVVSDDKCTRIVDWGSKNGIYVNGVRVTEKILKNGDKLTVGTARFKFEERHKRSE